MNTDNTNPEKAMPDATVADEADRREAAQPPKDPDADAKPEEEGGPSGPDPTRFGDWERKGRCIDF